MIYGPHCHHDGCAWSLCDVAESSREGVQFFCKELADCPYCGPQSQDWPRLATRWRKWANGRYKTDQPGVLRRINAESNVIAAAEVVAANPVVASITVERPHDECVRIVVNGVVVIEANHEEHGWDGMEAVVDTARGIAENLFIAFHSNNEDQQN